MKTVNDFLNRDIPDTPVINETLKKHSDSYIKSAFNRIYRKLLNTSDIKEIMKLNSELLLLMMEMIMKDAK